jgi:rubrerythrin
MLARVREVFGGRGGANTYSECRRCGLSVEDDAGSCPHCETESITRYELD